MNILQLTSSMAVSFRDSNLSEQNKIQYARTLGDLCFHHKTPVQDTAVKQGCVEPLLSLIQKSRNPVAISAYYFALGQLAFNNEFSSTAIVSWKDLIPVLQTGLNSNNFELEILSLRLATNSAANVWPQQHLFFPLIPKIVACISDPKKPIELRADCVGFINVLSYNKDCHDFLLKNNVIYPLVEIVKSEDIRLECTTAAIALANLTGDETTISLSDYSYIAVSLVECFQSTLLFSDYPVNSGLYFTAWKVSMSLTNICRKVENRKILRSAGLVDLLKKALLDRKKHPKPEQLTKYSLQLLWYLSSEN
eukprot:c619_g1_i1.p1 GENE.c619_g1_i1~~c619_g1_i1.p1  ORF type:complete len:316 (+),score=106.58 c619_g1_i1:27-950(+)